MRTTDKDKGKEDKEELDRTYRESKCLLTLVKIYWWFLGEISSLSIFLKYFTHTGAKIGVASNSVVESNQVTSASQRHYKTKVLRNPVNAPWKN